MYAGVPSDRPRYGQLVAGASSGRAGDPEVGDQRVTAGEQDVLRLDVPMDDTGRVGVVECLRHLAGQADRLVNAELGLPTQPLAQRFALHVRHDVPEHAVHVAAVV